MWDNKEFYNGLSVLPYNGGTYVQAPFEDIDKTKYNEMMETLQLVDIARKPIYLENLLVPEVLAKSLKLKKAVT